VSRRDTVAVPKDLGILVIPAAFDPAGACAYLGNVYTESALAKRRQRGQGPPFRRDEAGRILYSRVDLDAFVASLPRG
jgi:hypothetical protein